MPLRNDWKPAEELIRQMDRKLRTVNERLSLRTAKDLLTFLPDTLPQEFTTADIACRADIPRWLAQKMAYCLRKTAAVNMVGKRGNAVLYALPRRRRKRKAA